MGIVGVKKRWGRPLRGVCFFAKEVDWNEYIYIYIYIATAVFFRCFFFDVSKNYCCKVSFCWLLVPLHPFCGCGWMNDMPCLNGLLTVTARWIQVSPKIHFHKVIGGQLTFRILVFSLWLDVLGGLSSWFQWLGSPPFISHGVRPFGRGPTTRSLWYNN